MARLEIVILNWNTKDYLKQFLPGVIASCKGLPAEVVVADSHSTDGSDEVLRNDFPDVRSIILDDNYGFTGGYNRSLGILAGQLEAEGDPAEFYLLLNSDIEVEPGWIEPLLDWMDSHPDCAVCGPKLHAWQNKDCFEYAGAAGGYMDALGYPFCRGRVMKRVCMDNGGYDTPSPVLWATGAALCVRRSVWEELGGLDNRFFAHMEEIDFCWRARLHGYEVAVVPQSCIYHLGGGTLPQDSPFKLKLNFRNSLLTLGKNLAPTYMAAGASKGNAKLRAWCLISFRMALDWASAAVYLLTGHSDFAKAVFTAHKEYRSLKSQTVFEQPAGGKKVLGRYRGSIIIDSIIYGNRIFEHLRKYEDRY